MQMCIKDNINNIIIFSSFKFCIVVIRDIYAFNLKVKRKKVTRLAQTLFIIVNTLKNSIN